VAEFEKQVILRMLEQHHWHKGQTASALGIERKTLYRKMKKFNLL
jgi:two-component system response regulator AtoC